MTTTELCNQILEAAGLATARPWRWGRADWDERSKDPIGDDDALWGGDVQILTDGSARAEYSPDIDVFGDDAKYIVLAANHAPTLASKLKGMVEILGPKIKRAMSDFPDEEHGFHTYLSLGQAQELLKILEKC